VKKKIGSGGSSEVFEVLDESDVTKAVKQVRLFSKCSLTGKVETVQLSSLYLSEGVDSPQLISLQPTEVRTIELLLAR
jgi:hypothetical protein